MRTEDFSFQLPESRIAQNPVSPRDACKLMVLDRRTGRTKDLFFYDLPALLEPGDVMVLNRSEVIPARISFKIKERDVEVLLTKKINKSDWECMVRPGKLFKEGSSFLIGEEFRGTVKIVTESGLRIISFNLKDEEFEKALDKYGLPPYPPYIKHTGAKFEDYQTVYANQKGSVAAPTAGLHFTNKLLDELENMGVQIEYVTLHVGPGTFLPVKSDDPKKHVMHSEFYEINEATAAALNKARKEGRRIIAVGTTSVRVLESNFRKGIFTANKAETDIFIYPGYMWKCVDGLITNFHLPKSTLLMLVCSFAGTENTLKAYNRAVENNYRFYSFGDAMFIT